MAAAGPSFLESCQRAAREHGAAAVLSATAGMLAARFGVEGALELSDGEPTIVPPVPEADASPDLLGQVHEALLDRSERRGAGRFDTPRSIAEGVLGVVDDGQWHGHRICDPAAGGGAFLLAAARRLRVAGADPEAIVADQLWGADIGAEAATVVRDVLRLWLGEVGAARSATSIVPHVVAADSLVNGVASWPDAPADGFELVVGNPPFLGQLRRATTRTRALASELKRSHPGVVGPYTDSASLFVLAALRMARPGGRVGLLVPESMLTARDARRIREALLDDAVLEHLWIAGQMVFAARVRVCVPVLRRLHPGEANRPPRVTRSVGPAFESRGPAPGPVGAASWGSLLAGLQGVPVVVIARSAELSSVASMTAGFRDQYYGIASSVVDDPAGELGDSTHPRLVTSGAIDPAVCTWGSRPTSYGRRRWAAPRVDLARLGAADARLHQWAVARLIPKVVVASQTKVVEAVADVAGVWYPSTPTISVEPVEGWLWRVAAILMAPPVAAWLHAQSAGSALAAGHVRVTTARLRAIPLPADTVALAEAAERARAAHEATEATSRRAHLVALGELMTAAYGSPPEVCRWWVALLPAGDRA